MHEQYATDPRRSPRALAAFLVGAAIAAAVIVGHSGGNVERAAYGDGEIYLYIARNLTIPTDQVDPVVVERGTSLRFGRVGLPVAIWALAGGRDGAMAWTQVLLMILSGGFASAAAAHLFPRAGPLVALLPWLAPGFPLSISGGFADATALAAGLWAIRFALVGRWGPMVLTLAVGALVKESVLVIVAGLVILAIVRSEPRMIISCLAAIVPLGAWYLAVRARHGAIPLLDPYLAASDGNAQTPPGAIIRSLLHPPSVKGQVSAVVHLLAGVVGFALARRSTFGLLASVAAIQVLAAGPFAWEYIGEAARVFVVLQTLTIFAIVGRLRPELTLPQARALRRCDLVTARC